MHGECVLRQKGGVRPRLLELAGPSALSLIKLAVSSKGPTSDTPPKLLHEGVFLEECLSNVSDRQCDSLDPQSTLA